MTDSPPLFYTHATLKSIWQLTPGTWKSSSQNSGAGWASSRVCLVASHLGGCEDNDVLDITPGKAGPHLQHEGYHAGCQGGCS